jgi:hypothetical protein
MTTLIACLSTGKGTWGHVSRLLEDPQFDKAYLFTNEYGKENFTVNAKTELVSVNSEQGLKELRDEIHGFLKSKLQEGDIGINLISGTGKEHMALLAATLKLGVGIRLIALTKEGVEEL